MRAVKFSLLRGVCQTPAYVAFEKGFFQDEGLDVSIEIVATAYLVPHKLGSGECHFGVIPWTRVAASVQTRHPLVLCCGSGIEEAAIVVRTGLEPDDVQRVAVPREGGIKDLTAMGLLESLGWSDCELVRMPSGDGAILALVGGAADAASMVEPYATLMEKLGVGRIVRRTGDIWPGAPGCSLSTSAQLRDAEPELVSAAVRAYVKGQRYVIAHRDEAADLAARHIGVAARYVRAALEANQPDINAIRNQDAMDRIVDLMLRRGYIKAIPSPTQYRDLRFLDEASANAQPRVLAAAR